MNAAEVSNVVSTSEGAVNAAEVSNIVVGGYHLCVNQSCDLFSLLRHEIGKMLLQVSSCDQLIEGLHQLR